ncbi:hypothetical protein PR048_006856 [Dryococelus australis]|uniref:Uncharacterized protein n=1 Tax=Dryococelus australis TaxID=614101 RepID=A0ABQ9IC33_9NEOP|nr:hypothetical protein PR048_006856 [Dryococelus australis]
MNSLEAMTTLSIRTHNALPILCSLADNRSSEGDGRSHCQERNEETSSTSPNHMMQVKQPYSIDPAYARTFDACTKPSQVTAVILCRPCNCGKSELRSLQKPACTLTPQSLLPCRRVTHARRRRKYCTPVERLRVEAIPLYIRLSASPVRYATCCCTVLNHIALAIFEKHKYDEGCIATVLLWSAAAADVLTCLQGRAQQDAERCDGDVREPHVFSHLPCSPLAPGHSAATSPHHRAFNDYLLQPETVATRPSACYWIPYFTEEKGEIAVYSANPSRTRQQNGVTTSYVLERRSPTMILPSAAVLLKYTRYDSPTGFSGLLSEIEQIKLFNNNSNIQKDAAQQRADNNFQRKASEKLEVTVNGLYRLYEFSPARRDDGRQFGWMEVRVYVPNNREFGKLREAEVRVAGPGFEPRSSQMRVRKLTAAPPRSVGVKYVPGFILQQYMNAKWVRGDVVVRLLASTKANQVRIPPGSPPAFRMTQSCRTMPLVGRFSRGSSVFPTFASRRCSILTLFRPPPPIGSKDLVIKSCANFSTHAWMPNLRYDSVM